MVPRAYQKKLAGYVPGFTTPLQSNVILGISGISLGGMEGRTGSSSVNTVPKCELGISAFCLGSVNSMSFDLRVLIPV